MSLITAIAITLLFLNTIHFGHCRKNIDHSIGTRSTLTHKFHSKKVIDTRAGIISIKNCTKAIFGISCNYIEQVLSLQRRLKL